MHSKVSRPLVLLSNDDGHASAGLRAMRAALAETADVVVVAPETEQSATSHSLTLHRPLRLRELEPGVFSIDGTPADCIYVALHSTGRVLPRRPDVVVSGINHGLNLGQDVFYSGTVAAAREAALRRLPAVAVSADRDVDFARVATLGARLAFDLLALGAKGWGPRKRPPLLNLNVPRNWTGEVRATRLGARIYEETIDYRSDPRGKEYLWVGGPGVRHDEDPGSDTDAYDHGIASVTPLVLDLTCSAEMEMAAELAGAVTR
jgi:5'-nucleotidase